MPRPVVSVKSSRMSGKSTSSSRTRLLLSAKSSPLNKGDSQGQDYRLTLKCIKHSPHLKPRPEKNLGLLEFEQKVWSEAMASMGGLKKKVVPHAKVYDHIADNPYHCIPKGREFDARFGEQNQWRPIELPQVRKQTSGRVNILQWSQLPIYKPPPRSDSLPRWMVHTSGRRGDPEHYLPPSAVRASYVDRGGMELSFNDLVSMLATHGPVEFSLVEGDHTIIAVYQLMRDAAKAVESSHPRGLTVTWMDKRLYNMGHYLGLKSYSLLKDDMWLGGMARRFGTRSHTTIRAALGSTRSGSQSSPTNLQKTEKSAVKFKEAKAGIAKKKSVLEPLAFDVDI